MIALFVLKLSAGITLMWLLMPRQEVTDGFFRIQMRLVLGTAVLATLLLSRTPSWHSAEDPQTALKIAGWLKNLQIAAAVVAYPGSVFWALGRRLPGNICIWLLSLICLASVALHSFYVPNQGHSLLQLTSDLATSAVLGATLTGMLLGHWYLTTPSMSIRPLWWFTRMLLIAGGLRLLASGMALYQFGFSSSDMVYWVWLVMRLTGGVVVPVVVSLIVWRVLKYRNTQSATGILFSGLILVFMGEMTGTLLEHATHTPF